MSTHYEKGIAMVIIVILLFSIGFFFAEQDVSIVGKAVKVTGMDKR